MALLDLPCVVESYKTYDDVHLVKSNDIGQVHSCWGRAAMPDCPRQSTHEEAAVLLGLLQAADSMHLMEEQWQRSKW